MNKKPGIGIGIGIVVVCAIVTVAMFTGCIEEKTQSNADKLYSQAEEYYSRACYNTAYDLYSQARDEYLEMGDDQKARQSLLEMFKMKWITLEFPYNESEAEELIMENFPNVSQDRREPWLAEGYLQTLTSDGEKLYFWAFVSNIRFLNLDLLHEYAKAQNKSSFLDLGKDVVFRDYNNSNFESDQRYTYPTNYSGKGILNISRSQLPGTGILKLWIPIPIETESQVDVAIISVTPEEYLKNSPSIEDDIGIAYLEVPLDELEKDLNISVQFTFTCFERHFTFDYTQVGDYDTESNLYKQYTKSSQNIEITPQIREKAQDIVGDEENPYLAAKKIYEYNVGNVSYNLMPHVMLSTLSIPESSYVHESLRGDCVAQSMYFCALCRAEGIPARACGGLQQFPELGGDHFWAEFYLPDYGWVPVDVAIAESADWDYDATNEEREFWKEFYFGNLDAYRFVIQKDADLPLDPLPEEPIVFSMVRQFPAAVCNTSVNDIGGIVFSNWEFRVKPIDD
ncbi:MAG TPA: transglutaminase [Methanophagales archaeon]|nr:transglutaminase [Methanophagales archaeon]